MKKVSLLRTTLLVVLLTLTIMATAAPDDVPEMAVIPIVKYPNGDLLGSVSPAWQERNADVVGTKDEINDFYDRGSPQ